MKYDSRQLESIITVTELQYSDKNQITARQLVDQLSIRQMTDSKRYGNLK
jgi:hypothetical protein